MPDWLPIHTAPKDGTWIFVAIPPKVIPKSANSKWKIGWRHLSVKWTRAPESLPQRTLGKHAADLDGRHDGYWTCMPNGLKPVHGAPIWWMPIPDHPDTAHNYL